MSSILKFCKPLVVDRSALIMNKRNALKSMLYTSDAALAAKRRKQDEEKYALPLPPSKHTYRTELKQCIYPNNFLRPPYAQPERESDAIEFMITDIDMTNTLTPLWDIEKKYKGAEEARPNYWSCFVRLFGVTKTGHSVCCYLKGWKPYIYVEVPQHWSNVHVEKWLDALEEQPNLDKLQRNLASYKLTERINIYGYTKGTLIKVVKLEFVNASTKRKLVKLLSAYKDVADNKIKHTYCYRHEPMHRFWLWDSMVNNKQQFINSTNIAPCKWARLEPQCYEFHQRASVLERERRARTQMDVNAFYHDVTMLPDRNDIPPLLIESWDSEVMRGARDRKFPNSSVPGDEMFQIGTSVMCFGDTYEQIPRYSAVHCVRPTDTLKPDEMHINEFANEREALRNYNIFTRDKVDADVRIDFNGKKFDAKYWADRSEQHLGSARSDRTVPYKYSSFGDGKFEYGRIRGELSACKENYGGSKAHGSREKNEIRMTGRVQLDLFQWASEEWKMPRSLNFVAKDTYNRVSRGNTALKESDFVKLDLPFYVLHEKYVATSRDRADVAAYCAVDTHVPLRVVHVRQILLGVIEVSRLTGITVDDVINRKQMVRTFSKLSKYAHDRNYMFPEFPERFVLDPHLREMMFGENSYEGATVIAPQRGYYSTYVTTLDYAALYPSIMRAHKLCYTTLILNPKWLLDNDTKYITIKIRNKDPLKEPYVLHWCINWKPLLYGLLTEILDARANAKLLKKTNADDAFLFSLYDARQLALKLIANSAYGFCGAKVGKLPNLALAAAVTYFGRDLIELTRDAVHRLQPECRVIYGDTDSVMIRCPPEWSREHVFDMSKKLAADITTLIGRKEVVLEFEKVYDGYILFQKKNYVGLKIEHIDDEPVYAAKGINSVRGDRIGFVKRNTDLILNALLRDRSPQKAIALLKSDLDRLVKGEIDAKELVQEKKLTKSLSEYPPNTVHVRVAREMQRRDPGTAPRAGEIVSFVCVQGKKSVNPIDYEHYCANRQRYKLDLPYYIENLMIESLGKLLDLKEICDDPYRIFQQYLAKARSDAIGVRPITSYLKSETTIDTSDFVKPIGVKKVASKYKRSIEKKRKSKSLKDEAKQRGCTVQALKRTKLPSIRRFMK